MSIRNKYYQVVFVFILFSCSSEDDKQCFYSLKFKEGDTCDVLNSNPSSKYYNQTIGKIIELETWDIPNNNNCDSTLLHSGVKFYNFEKDTINFLILQSVQNGIPILIKVSLNPKDSIEILKTLINCENLIGITFLN